MKKTAVLLKLCCVDDCSQTMCIHAVLADGRLALATMHFHLFEWNGVCNEIYPGLLVNLDGAHGKYFVEWGKNSGWSEMVNFPHQPLAVGQLVVRTDISPHSLGELVYRVDSLVDLLA